MRKHLIVLLLTLGPIVAVAAERPQWAFPEIDKVLPSGKDDGQPKQMPGSAKSFTQAQIDDPMNPPDWFPDEHPPMPQIVAHGGGGKLRACAACHLTSGMGHPESSALAGLTTGYLTRQMADFKSGARKAAPMTPIAAEISDEDVKAASDYFASLKPVVFTKVVETNTVPNTYIGKGNMRLPHPDGGTEPLGNRIIELPVDPSRATARDPRSGAVAYVPAGSIAKGETLVKTGAGRTVPCAACHGPDLKGLGEIPGIAGRPAIYNVRQLYNFQTGDRAGAFAPIMKPVVDKLDTDDMIAIAAYLASRGP